MAKETNPGYNWRRMLHDIKLCNEQSFFVEANEATRVTFGEKITMSNSFQYISCGLRIDNCNNKSLFMARPDPGLKNTLTRNCNKEATFREI